MQKLARCLKDKKRLVVECNVQKMPEKAVVWSDTDFAGCKRTGRSTSGGVVMFGNHCIKMYSQTQETIALASVESEFYRIAKAAAMGLGMKGLMEDLGVEVEVQVNTDSSAAKSITPRKGAGRVRHIEVRELWVQDLAAKGELTIVKVKGEENVADGLTKHVDRHRMEQYMKACGMVRWSGRHALSPSHGDSV